MNRAARTIFAALGSLGLWLAAAPVASASTSFVISTYQSNTARGYEV